jgi:hypothetical protein
MTKPFSCCKCGKIAGNGCKKTGCLFVIKKITNSERAIFPSPINPILRSLEFFPQIVSGPGAYYHDDVIHEK